jgi:DNA replication protein
LHFCRQKSTINHPKMSFSGFPSGRVNVTPLPDLFFSDLLGQIDDLPELKLTLHVFWRLAHHKSPLCLSRAELAADPVLRQNLGADALDAALERTVARQSLFVIRARNKAGQVEQWYFMNNEAGRHDAALVRKGSLKLQRDAALLPTAPTSEHLTIFTLYEQHIGMLTPMLAEQLKDAAQTYPPDWIAEAFETARQNNKRNWRYVEVILQTWTRDGRGRLPPAEPVPARRPPMLRPKPRR